MSLDEPTAPEGPKPQPLTPLQFQVFALLERMPLGDTIDIFGHALRKIHGARFVMEVKQGEFTQSETDTLDPVPVVGTLEEESTPFARFTQDADDDG